MYVSQARSRISLLYVTNFRSAMRKNQYLWHAVNWLHYHRGSIFVISLRFYLTATVPTGEFAFWRVQIRSTRKKDTGLIDPNRGWKASRTWKQVHRHKSNDVGDSRGKSWSQPEGIKRSGWEIVNLFENDSSTHVCVTLEDRKTSAREGRFDSSEENLDFSRTLIRLSLIKKK